METGPSLALGLAFTFALGFTLGLLLKSRVKITNDI
jgi:hypothetical protein